MRTDLTATLAGSEVRGVVTVAGLREAQGSRKWGEFLDAINDGDPAAVEAVLSAALRDAGDLRPLDVKREVTRLMEEAGVGHVAAFAIRLLNDAIYKTETARKNSPAAVPAGAAAETTKT